LNLEVAPEPHRRPAFARSGLAFLALRRTGELEIDTNAEYLCRWMPATASWRVPGVPPGAGTPACTLPVIDHEK
jgi:hypothetical protein